MTCLLCARLERDFLCQKGLGSITARKLHQALKALGFNPGPVDDVRGRLTIKAIRAFQCKYRLKVDGIAGLKAWAKIHEEIGTKRPARATEATNDSVACFSLWLEEAKRLSGALEGRGKGLNPKILGWAKRMRTWYPHDGMAWCGSIKGWKDHVGFYVDEEKTPIPFWAATSPML